MLKYWNNLVEVEVLKFWSFLKININLIKMTKAHNKWLKLKLKI